MPKTMFLYWGRRGAIAQMTLRLAEVSGGDALFSVAEQSELYRETMARATVIPVCTFERNIGALLHLPRIVRIRRQVAAAIQAHRVQKAVVLMPHVWTPLVASAIRSAGATYAVIIHDVVPHPGDNTALATRWLLRSAYQADEVITLSRFVGSQLAAAHPALTGKMKVLFHPLFVERPMPLPPSQRGRSIGFLFQGRIMAYKGLPLFVEASEILRQRGHAFRVGVVGEGPLGGLASRLNALSAEIINRWVAHGEMDDIVPRYDALILSNTEASQSGGVPLAHSFGLPVIATPVGAIPEQLGGGRSGLLASEVTPLALANAMERFLTDAELRQRLHIQVEQARNDCSMAKFYEAITA